MTTGRRLMWCAVILGVAFRIIGAVVNTEANDDHMAVVRTIAHERRIPAPAESPEAFQPLLYHVTVAAALIVAPPLSAAAEDRLAQSFSCMAGILTLALLIRLVFELRLANTVTELTIALASLNPALISTSIQATNDAFVILFATVAIYVGAQGLRPVHFGKLLMMVLATVLACLSKGNGLVMAVAVLITLCVAAWCQPFYRRTLVSSALALVLLFAAIVPVAGGFITRRAQMGSWFAINQSPRAPAYFVRETFPERPGITSIANGYLTFRFIDMLTKPLLEAPEGEDYPRHRTSLWSALYGAGHSALFSYYPDAWRVPRPAAEAVVRADLMLALPATLVLVIGTWRTWVDVARGVLSRETSGDLPALMLIGWVMAGYIAFIIVYSYRYRDYATMKTIFICPAAAAFLSSFARELERWTSSRWRLIRVGTVTSVGLLCVCYVVDIGLLLGWLTFS